LQLNLREELNGSEVSSFDFFFLTWKLSNGERHTLVFLVMERHRKELGILRSDGTNTGRSRRSQEDQKYFQVRGREMTSCSSRIREELQGAKPQESRLCEFNGLWILPKLCKISLLRKSCLT